MLHKQQGTYKSQFQHSVQHIHDGDVDNILMTDKQSTEGSRDESKQH